MTSNGSDILGAITSIFWRKVTPGDFFNIERTTDAGPQGGGGQLYIDIPLSDQVGRLSPESFGRFFTGEPLAENSVDWGPIPLTVYTASSPVIQHSLLLTPRRGPNRRYRIANQNRQAAGGQRHPAWSPERGFPQAPDDIATRRDDRIPDLGHLKVFIAGTDRREFLAGYVNSATMPASWPRGTGLETLFRRNMDVAADGIIEINAESELTPRLLSEVSTPPREEPRHQVSYPVSRARVVPHSAPDLRPRSATPLSKDKDAVRRADQIGVAIPHAIRASEAEDWVERHLRERYGHQNIQRIGHTDREKVTLPDGDIPGADFIVLAPGTEQPERFVEVKSATKSLPPSVRLTAAELRRAKRCAAEGIPFEIWIVVFGQGSTTHTIVHNFEGVAVSLTIDELPSIEVLVKPDDDPGILEADTD